MKKSALIVFVFIIFLLSIVFVSASWFSDFWQKAFSPVPNQISFSPVDYISNGGFESDLSSWRTYLDSTSSSNSVDISLTEKHSGSKSVQIHGHAFVRQDPAVLNNAQGSLFNLSFWMKNDITAHPRVTVREVTSGNVIRVFDTPISTSWKQYSFVFSLPSNINYRLTFGNDAIDNGLNINSWYDNIALFNLITQTAYYSSSSPVLDQTCLFNSQIVNSNSLAVGDQWNRFLCFNGQIFSHIHGIATDTWTTNVVACAIKGSYYAYPNYPDAEWQGGWKIGIGNGGVQCGANSYCNGNGACISSTPQSTCTETDATQDPNVAGTCTDSTGQHPDTCVGNMLWQTLCSSNSCVNPSTGAFDCTSVGKICQNGACVSTSPSITCTDSDVNSQYPNGKNPLIQGTVSVTGLPPYTDSCVDSNTVNEWFCGSSSGPPGSVGISCGSGYSCVNGACISQQPNPQPTTCTDSDGGNNLLIKGTATDGTISKTDSCTTINGVNYIVENVCLNNAPYENPPAPCPDGYSCSNGACISQQSSTKKIVNLTDAVINTNLCGGYPGNNVNGYITISCVTNDSTNSIEGVWNFLANNFSYAIEYSGNVQRVNFIINLNKSVVGNYNAGCQLTNTRSDSDIIGISNYPQGVNNALTKAININSCSSGVISCSDSSQCSSGQFCSNHECISNNQNGEGNPPVLCLFNGLYLTPGQVASEGGIGKYCGLDGIVHLQKNKNESCSGNFECLSNICVVQNGARVCKETFGGNTNSGGEQLKSCSELEGEICKSDEVCSTNEIRTSDSNYCCLGNCNPAGGENSSIRNPGLGNGGGQSKLTSGVLWTIISVLLILSIIVSYFIWVIYKKRKLQTIPSLKIQRPSLGPPSVFIRR